MLFLMRSLRIVLGFFVLSSAGMMAACQGCRGGRSTTSIAAPPPTIRLYLLSTVAGELEPCGCSKDQLGGLDHFAAFVNAERSHAPNALVLAAGPLFFLDPTSRGAQTTQDLWKAHTIATGLSQVGFTGWAPGANDWAAGAQNLATLREESHGALLAANVASEAADGSQRPPQVRYAVVAGWKVGLVGISQPSRMGVPPEGVQVHPAEEQLRHAIEEAKRSGAQILVGAFAMPRGEALRLLDNAGELQVLLLGKPFDQGDANNKPSPPAMIGKTLVVEAANHLQTVSVVDLYIRDGKLDFQDAAGVSRSAERTGLSERVEELSRKIHDWEENGTANGKDLQARRADLEKLRQELRAVETPPPPTSGSFFRYSSVEIRTELGRDKAVYEAMLAYYQKVNDHNRTAFADRRPPPPGPDGNRYIGLQACSTCHATAREVWNHTAHAHAYKTLSDQHKEFNLDCVGCHVTGYEQPGGSTVTVNDGLRDVQCEDCHGPGERHRQSPVEKGLIIANPKPDNCVSSCHHPPHVEGFDPVAQMHHVLGPGHGHPENWPPVMKR